VIASMTGYGEAARHDALWSVQVALRSVNHGELRVAARVPDMLRHRENDLISLVRRELSRGHVTVQVRCELAEDALGLLVDRKRLRGYLKLAREVAAEQGVPFQVEAGSVLSLPGVISGESVPDEVRDAAWPLVADASEEALAKLVEMRRAEGQYLAAEIARLCDEIVARTGAVRAGVADAVQSVQARLRERIAALLEGSDVVPEPDALAREVAIMAERADVTEELARLGSHLGQFREVMASDQEAVGKRLEFLVQEMLREANTMASKLPSSELVQQAIEIKADVHRLREQLRNVE